MCSHGDLIPKMIRRLVGAGMRTKDANISQKGSLWVIEVEKGRPVKGKYYPRTEVGYLRPYCCSWLRRPSTMSVIAGGTLAGSTASRSAVASAFRPWRWKMIARKIRASA